MARKAGTKTIENYNKALRNARSRINYNQSKGYETQPITAPNKKAVKQMTLKEVNAEIRKLNNLTSSKIKETSNFKVNDKLSVPGSEYVNYMKNRKQENKLRKKHGLEPLNTEVSATSKEGWNKLVEGTKERSKSTYYKQREFQMVENFKKTLDYLSPEAKKAILDKIKKLGVHETAMRLQDGVYNSGKVNASFLFDSENFTGIQNEEAEFLEYWDLELENYDLGD